MTSKKCDCPKSDPSSPNYAEKMKSKASNKSPYGENEPSTKTTYK